MDIYFPPDQGITQPGTTILAASKSSKEKIVGACDAVREVGTPSFGLIAQFYLRKYEGKDPMDVDISKIEIKLLSITKQPAHGRLILEENDPYGGGTYHPDTGYFGKDGFEALVSVGKDIVRVVYHYTVQPTPTEQLSEAQYKKLCPKGFYWKISSNLPTGTDDFTNWQTTAKLNAMLANASGSLTNFSGLTASPRVVT